MFNLLLNLFLIYLTICASQRLKVEYSSAFLPQADSCHGVHYDNNDSIFIFGGCGPTAERQIVKYSLSSDTISRIGTLPTVFKSGSVHSDTEGNLLLFGAGSAFNQVIRYNGNENASLIVA